MKKNENPVLGLDVGTSRIVLARKSGDDFTFESQLNAFTTVEHSRMIESALKRDQIPFSVENTQLFIHGNEAPRFADLLSTETRRPMTQGVINPSEIESVTVIRRIIESLTRHADGARPKLTFSVPASPLNGEESLTYHEATLRQIFDELGYDVRSINEGLAVIYSELEDTNYTGIGISFGGGLVNVSLAWLAMPVLSFSIPKAGDFIDASTASVTGDLSTRVRLAKEATFHFNGHFTDQLHQVLTVYYEDMIHSIISAMKEAFSDSKRMPKLTKPVPVVLSGGTASPAGFRERFEKMLQLTEFPVSVSEIRVARDPHTTTARGALISALTEM